MPITASRGIMSARGFGLFGNIKIVVGTQGIMSTGGNTNATRTYNWSNDVVAASTNMISAANVPGAGAGIAAFAILPIGANSPSGATNKYRHSTAAMTVSTSLGIAYSSSGAYGNTNVGLFIKQGSSTGNVVTATYQYSDDTVNGGGNLVTPRASDPTVLGDSTRAIISGSTVNNAASAVLDAYTYANNTCATTTSLPVVRSSAASTGVGNADVGIFTRAATTTATQKFTYASSTTAASGTLTAAGANGQSCGSSTTGIIVNSVSTTTGLGKYFYSNDTTGTGSTMPSPAPSRPNFVNNGTVGVNA